MLNGAYTITKTVLTKANLWHKRLLHISPKGMQALSKQGILRQGNSEHLSFCEHCMIGKATRHMFTKAQHTTKGILDYVHSDLWGPASTPSLSGSRYLLYLIDDYSRKN